jgi:predicted RNase H-like HicB family nuclease
MKTIRIIIERNEDGFWAYAENEKGIIGGGESVEACKQDILDSIETMKSLDGKNKFKYEEGKYELIYKFDTESLLEYYKGIITNMGVEKLTGINHKLVSQYATGLKKPRPAQRKKIEEGLHKLGKELLAIEL